MHAELLGGPAGDHRAGEHLRRRPPARAPRRGRGRGAPGSRGAARVPASAVGAVRGGPPREDEVQGLLGGARRETRADLGLLPGLGRRARRIRAAERHLDLRLARAGGRGPAAASGGHPRRGLRGDHRTGGRPHRLRGHHRGGARRQRQLGGPDPAQPRVVAVLDAGLAVDELPRPPGPGGGRRQRRRAARPVRVPARRPAPTSSSCRTPTARRGTPPPAAAPTSSRSPTAP